MKINDFMKVIDPITVERGLDYYNEKRVCFIVKSDDVYHFIVQGTDRYCVELEFDDLDEVNSKCDCPYDFGDVCKHQVSALYYYKNDIANKKAKTLDLDFVLKELSIKQLRREYKKLLLENKLLLAEFMFSSNRL